MAKFEHPWFFDSFDKKYDVRVCLQTDGETCRYIIQGKESPRNRLYHNVTLRETDQFGCGRIFFTQDDGALIVLPWYQIISITPVNEVTAQ